MGGVFETIGKTLGVGEDKYFLELDDTVETDIKPLKASAPKPVETAANSVKERVSPVAAQPKVAAVVSQAKVEKVATDNLSKTSKKAESAGKSDQKAAVATQSVIPQEPSAQELIVNAIAAASTKEVSKTEVTDDTTVEVQNFSTNYLMPLGNRGRRRPGPALSPFRGMAKAVNASLR